MDSGMAAIIGASLDFQLRGKRKFIVLDIATSHTVCAAIDGGEIAGFVDTIRGTSAWRNWSRFW